jgi:hypothetical protein
VAPRPDPEEKQNKHKQQQNNNLACNADSGRAVVLSLPRSAFLAYFQPAGASRSLQGSNSKKQHFDGNDVN